MAAGTTPRPPDPARHGPRFRDRHRRRPRRRSRRLHHQALLDQRAARPCPGTPSRRERRGYQRGDRARAVAHPAGVVRRRDRHDPRRRLSPRRGMRRRITAAIVGVTAFILLALGIPLAVVIQRSAVRAELVELQRTAAATLTEIEVPLDAARLAALVNEPDAPPPFTVYDRSGSVVFGQPDPRTEAIAQSALGGASATSSGGELAAATPITDADENVVGALVVTKSLADANATARVAWMVMVAIGIVAVGFAWLIASRLSRRLARPIIELAESAANTGVGGVLAPAEPTGIIEIDVLHDALLDQSRQVNEALARERRF